MSETKKITLWIQPSWDHQSYSEEVDTDILLSEWEKMSEEEKEEAGDEVAGFHRANLVEWGWYE